MKKLIRAIIFIFIIIILPVLTETISNHITMDMIMKGVYFTLGLVLVALGKAGR